LGLVELCQFLPPLDCMAEIGSAIGESAGIFLQHTSVRIIFCVDRFRDSEGREIEFDRVHSWNPRVVKKKLESPGAANEFPDRSLDFVYIDATHGYPHPKLDIEAWLPKVREDGWIGGHDYTWKHQGVIRAVAEKFDRPDYVFRDGSWLVKLINGWDQMVGVKDG